MNLSGKKLLVLGATGAMGQYLVPVLAEKGFLVDAVSLDTPREPFPGVNYIKSDAKEWSNLCKLLENRYDGIVDFMIYPTGELATYLPLLLDNTDHYIYLSSYRIYDNKEHPIRESSPRLLDSSEDVLLRNTDGRAGKTSSAAGPGATGRSSGRRSPTRFCGISSSRSRRPTPSVVHSREKSPHCRNRHGTFKRP